MLGAKDAKKVIEQLQTETFLCTKDVIATSDFVIVKKSRKITDNKVIAAVKSMGGR